MAETNDFVQPPLNTGVGKKVDHAGFTVGSESVVRQRVQVGVPTKVVNASFTRPSDTTTYAAGEVVGPTGGGDSKITFAGVAREGAQSGLIVSAKLFGSANQTLKADLELYLFDTSIVGDADNALWTPTDAELKTAIGVIDFGVTPYVGDAAAGASGNVLYQALGLNLEFKCTGALLDIYGILVVRNAYVPVSAEEFLIRLGVIQD